MPRLKQLLLILAIASLGRAVSAHHAAHYKTLWEAYKRQDLESAKALFSEDCWRKKRGDISGKKLAELLRKASQIESRVVHEYSQNVNCILRIQFYLHGEDKPRRYWLLSEPVHDKRNGNSDPLKYRVKTITTSNKLAARHIKRDPQFPLAFGKFPRRSTAQDADKLSPAENRLESIVSSTFRGANAGDNRNVFGIRLCWCPPGQFTMGSPPSELERRPGEEQVTVTLTKGFWMSKYEITQGQWKRVMGPLPGELTAELPEGDKFPVGKMNFAEAEAFCDRLTELARRSGELAKDWEFRLPTEAQWEYACRAGTTTATSFGDRLSSNQANFKGKPYNEAEPGPSLNRAARVGSYPPNAWGLHDMHGNIYEWTRDWYHAKLPGGRNPDLHDAQTSATKSEHGGISRVRRGGCWADQGWACRTAFRLRFEPERRYDHIGFRIVAVPPSQRPLVPRDRPAGVR